MNVVVGHSRRTGLLSYKENIARKRFLNGKERFIERNALLGMEKVMQVTRQKILDGGRKNWVKIFIKCEENILIFIEKLQMFLGHIDFNKKV